MSSAKAKIPGKSGIKPGQLKVKLKTKSPANNKKDLAAKKPLKRRSNVPSASVDKPSEVSFKYLYLVELSFG